jgi:hypothetical protein
MPFNGSGTFFRIHNFEADRNALIPVTSVRVDAELQGIADGLSNCLTRDGQSTSTGPISFQTVRFGDGTPAEPSITFINDTHLGFYRATANTLGLSANSANLASFAHGEILMVPNKLSVVKAFDGALAFNLKNSNLGADAAARIDMQGGVVTGVIHINHDTTGDGLTGAMHVGTDGNYPVRFVVGSAYNLDLWPTHMVAHVQILAISGTQELPAYSFAGDNNTGLYRQSNGILGISCDGLTPVTISQSLMTVAVQIRGNSGSKEVPGYSFVGDDDSGFYHQPADGTIGVSNNGINTVSFAQTYTGIGVPILSNVAVGNPAAPAYSFVPDAGTGIYLSGLGNVGISSNAVPVAIFNPQGGFFRDGTSGGTNLPGIGFIADLNTGFSRPASDAINVVCGGQVAATFTVSALYVPSGTPSAPGISFAYDAAVDTGIYWQAENNIGISAAGTPVAVFNPQGGFFSAGMATVPGISFLLDTNTGLSNPSGDNINVVCGGVASATFKATAALFPAGPASTPGISFLQDQSTGLRLHAANTMTVLAGSQILAVYQPGGSTTYAANGTADQPSYSFLTDDNTGIFRQAAANIGISADGTLVAVFAPPGAFFAAGSQVVPGISFLLDTDTGFSNAVANSINVICGGVLSTVFSGAGVYFPDGAVALPGISFGQDSNTGIYRAAQDLMRIVANAKPLMGFDGSAGNDRVHLYYGLLNLAANAPAAPQDGDFWASGSSVHIRLGGVTKTFTLT